MTPLQLRFAALKETGIVGLLETPEAEHDTLAQEKYALLHAMLLKDRLATWALTEDIPAGACQGVIWMLAYLCAPRLGAPPEEIVRLMPLGMYPSNPPSLGEKTLRKFISQRFVSQPATADYF